MRLERRNRAADGRFRSPSAIAPPGREIARRDRERLRHCQGPTTRVATDHPADRSVADLKRNSGGDGRESQQGRAASPGSSQGHRIVTPGGSRPRHASARRLAQDRVGSMSPGRCRTRVVARSRPSASTSPMTAKGQRSRSRARRMGKCSAERPARSAPAPRCTRARAGHTRLGADHLRRRCAPLSTVRTDSGTAFDRPCRNVGVRAPGCPGHRPAASILPVPALDLRVPR